MESQLSGDESGLEVYYRFDSPFAGASTVDVEIAEDDTLGLEVDYENVSGQADVSVSWRKANTFTVSYYDSADWSGDASATDWEERINHNWGAGLPGDNETENEYGLTGNDFSAVWEGTFTLSSVSGSQSYIFGVTTDNINNVQLYVDGTQQTSFTQVGSTDNYYVPVTISNASSYEITLKYSHSGAEDDDDALIRLAWLPADAWFLTPYEPDGNAGWTRYDLPIITTEINQATNNHVDNEGQTANYDALWDYSGFFNFSTTGVYDFIIRADDGIKLVVDGKEYLGHWNIDAATAYIVPVTLDAGYHLIQVEHYDQISSSGGNNYMVREIDWSLRQDNEFIGFYYSSEEDMDADDPWDADTYDGTEPLLIAKSNDSNSPISDDCTFTASSLNCSWGTSSPTADLEGIDSAYLNTDNFGVRWIGDFDFTEGVYVISFFKATHAPIRSFPGAKVLNVGANNFNITSNLTTRLLTIEYNGSGD
jgi:hypothetical protein